MKKLLVFLEALVHTFVFKVVKLRNRQRKDSMLLGKCCSQRFC